MPDRVDRSKGSGLTLLVVVALLIAAAIGGFAWWRKTGTPAVAEQKQALQQQAAGIMDPLSMTLFFPGDGALLTGPVSVKRQPDTQSQARETLAIAFADPRSAQAPVLKDVKLRGLFLDAAGIAYVDLAPVPVTGLNGSADEEMLALYAIVNTLNQNFEEIKQVRFLVEGKEAQSLAGHVDLLRTFTKRMDLVK